MLTQFEGVEFDTFRIPFVDSEEKAHAAAARIRNIYMASGVRPILINSVIDPAISEVLASCGALMLDIRAIHRLLEGELGMKRSRSAARMA